MSFGEHNFTTESPTYLFLAKVLSYKVELKHADISPISGDFWSQPGDWCRSILALDAELASGQAVDRSDRGSRAGPPALFWAWLVALDAGPVAVPELKLYRDATIMNNLSLAIRRYLTPVLILAALIGRPKPIPAIAQFGPYTETMWVLDTGFAEEGTHYFEPISDNFWDFKFSLHLRADGKFILYQSYYWRDGRPIHHVKETLLLDIRGQYLHHVDVMNGAPGILGERDVLYVIRTEYGDGPPYLLKLDANFEQDPSFALDPNFPSHVVKIHDLDRYGYLYVSTPWAHEDGSLVFRLQPSGSLDPTFPAGLGPFQTLHAVSDHPEHGFAILEDHAAGAWPFCSGQMFGVTGDFLNYIYYLQGGTQFVRCSGRRIIAGGADTYLWSDGFDKVIESRTDGTRVFETNVFDLIVAAYGDQNVDDNQRRGAHIAHGPHGRIWVITSVVPRDNVYPEPYRYYLIRLLPNGSPDFSFGHSAVMEIPSGFHSVGQSAIDTQKEFLVEPNGNLVIPGMLNGQFKIIRLTEVDIQTRIYFPIWGGGP